MPLVKNLRASTVVALLDPISPLQNKYYIVLFLMQLTTPQKDI